MQDCVISSKPHCRRGRIAQIEWLASPFFSWYAFNPWSILLMESIMWMSSAECFKYLYIAKCLHHFSEVEEIFWFHLVHVSIFLSMGSTILWTDLSSGYVRRLPPDRGIRDRKVSLHSMVLWRFYSETENYIVRPHTTTTQEQVPRSLLNRVTSDPRAQTNAFHLRRLLICQNALANTFWPA